MHYIKNSQVIINYGWMYNIQCDTLEEQYAFAIIHGWTKSVGGMAYIPSQFCKLLYLSEEETQHIVELLEYKGLIKKGKVRMYGAEYIAYKSVPYNYQFD